MLHQNQLVKPSQISWSFKSDWGNVGFQLHLSLHQQLYFSISSASSEASLSRFSFIPCSNVTTLLTGRELETPTWPHPKVSSKKLIEAAHISHTMLHEALK